MKLDGAEVKNIYGLCSGIGTGVDLPLRVTIPYYQRPYKWTIGHIENLFSDFFLNLKDSSEKEYFLGSVVLVKTDGSDFYEVVDGQQRTTTVFLLNYILFLLQRCYIEELFISQKTNTISQALVDLCKTMNMLFVMGNEEKKSFDEYCKGISDRLDDVVDTLDVDEKDKKCEKLLDEFRNLFGLPLTKDLSAPDIYCQLASDSMIDYLQDRNLTLQYSRKSYNELLKEALSLVVILYGTSFTPEMRVTSTVEDETPLAVYVNALVAEFRCLKARSSDDDTNPLKKIKFMMEDIKCMLSNLNFCKILTGNEQDAYTLFEVLNDRALEVEDLELVKNMFFKKYCSSSADSETTKDKHIEKLDNLWGDEIFHGTRVSQTKLISYCASVYLTGTTDLVTNKGQRYRDVLQEKYLNKKKMYEYKDVLLDFQIFLAVRHITDKFDLKYQTTCRYGIIAENDINKSNVYKTLNLIHALDYTAVMPALVNVIIKTYFEENGTDKFDLKVFDGYLDEIITVGNTDKHNRVYECAELLRKAVLLAKDYKIPREIARNVIEHINKTIYDASSLVMSANNADALKEEFKVWTKEWRYGAEKQNFKLKVLFLNLYGTEKENDTLNLKAAKYTLSSDLEVALDHLDAQKIDTSASEKYFEPSDSTDIREDYINSIGNMMILDGKNNGDKNNKPLYQALAYHKKLANHWLIQEIDYMLNDDNYSKEVLIEGQSIRVANEKFFTQRIRQLQKYFYSLTTKDRTATTVQIKDL